MVLPLFLPVYVFLVSLSRVCGQHTFRHFSCPCHEIQRTVTVSVETGLTTLDRPLVLRVHRRTGETSNGVFWGVR